MKVETKLAENIDEIKTKLNSLNGMFDSLEIGDHNLKEIFWWKSFIWRFCDI